MPIVMVQSNELGAGRVPRYGQCPIPYYPTHCSLEMTEAGLAALKKLRAEQATLQQDFIALQKECGRDNPEGARLMKGYAKDALRMVTACNLWIKRYEQGPGKPGISTATFPVELAFELDLAASIASLAEI